MFDQKVIVIGASLGGMHALQELCARLPEDLPAAVFVVWHTARIAGPGALPALLDASGPLPAAYAREGEQIVSRRIYVAPPDHHLILDADVVHTTRGPRENRFRPAIDPMFRSAANVFGARAIGALLTGMLDDGTQGLWYVKRRGGTTVAQDPSDAEAPDMPASAIAEGVVDHVLRLEDIAPMLVRLSREPSVSFPHGKSLGESPMAETRDEHDMDALHPPDASSPPTSVTCPDCNGAIWISDEPGPLRFRCHVGHQFSERGFGAAKMEELELALWTALRTLKESTALHGTLAERARKNGRLAAAASYEQTREELQYKVGVLRRALTQDVAP